MKVYALTIKLFLVSIFFISCSPYVNVVEVQTLNPTTTALSFVNKDVAIVGNLYYEPDESGEYLYDSTLVAQATLGIKNTLEQSPAFDNYTIPIYYTYSADTSLVAKAMSQTDIDSMAKDMGVDMFVSVDYIDVAAGEADDKEDISFSMMFYGLFRVYEVGVEKPHASYIFKSDEPHNIMMSDENGIYVTATAKDAKSSLARRLGENYAMYISPYWENVKRIYYIGPDDGYGNLRKGDRYAQQNNWAKAMEYWNNTINSSSKKAQVAMAAFNMAVGCEMLGDLELAQSWLEYCKKQQVSNVDPSSYARVINERIKDKKILDEKLLIE